MELPRFGVGVDWCRDTLRIGLVLLCLSVLAGCATTSEEEYVGPDLEQIERQAQSAQKRGQYATALKFYLEVLDGRPDDVEVLYQIGRNQQLLDHRDHAMKAYMDVLERQPDHVLALSNLAIIHLEFGDRWQAQTLLDKAIGLDQERLRAHDQSVTVLVGSVDSQPMLPLDDISPDQGYLAKGIIQDLDGFYYQAQALYRLVLAQQPTSAKVLNNLGYSYYLSGELNKAAVYLRQATQREPDFRRAWTNLGLVYARQQQTQRALQAFKRVMPAPDALNDLGYFALLQGQLDKAEGLFVQAIDASPTYFSKAQDNLRVVQRMRVRGEALEELQKTLGGAEGFSKLSQLDGATRQ